MSDGPRTYSRTELVEDARALAATLEETHPDPYSGHGGRVAFHRNLETLVRAIPEDGEAVGEFYERVAEFTAQVRDAHTGVSSPDELDTGGEVNGRLPLGFRVVDTDLYVDSVYGDTHSDLLGGRLASVEGTSVADLRTRVAEGESADNRYDDLVNLSRRLAELDGLARLLGEPTTALTVSVETTDGTTVERTLEPVVADGEGGSVDPVETLETTVERPDTEGEPAYRFLDAERSTALLALPDMRLYREHPEMLASMDHERAEERARDAYTEVVGEPAPDDPDDVLAGLPSATDVLTGLVEEMADAGTETLLVDTRDNLGGNSVLTYVLTYVLYGWDGLADVTAGNVSVPKDSELYRRHYGEDGAVGDPDNPAGFDFESYFERRDRERRLERQHERIELTPTFHDEVESGEHAGYYRPENVVVVTSAGTHSAGAEPAFLLSKLDATVAGVPPAQSPNGPRDLLRDELPNTGLAYRVSFRHVEFCPGEDGDVFDPDVELTPERFEALDRAGDAGIRLALAHVNDDVPSDERVG